MPKEKKEIKLFGTPGGGGSHILIRASTINSSDATPSSGGLQDKVSVFFSDPPFSAQDILFITKKARRGP